MALSVGSPLLGVTQPSARWSSDFPPPDIIRERSPGLLGPLKLYYKADDKSNEGLARAGVPSQEIEDYLVRLLRRLNEVAVAHVFHDDELGIGYPGGEEPRVFDGN